MKKTFAVLVAFALVASLSFAEDKAAAPAATAAPAVAAAEAPAPAVTSVEGTITKVVGKTATKSGAEELSVTGTDGKTYDFSVTAATKITNSKGVALKFSSLGKKMKVKVSYATDAKGLVANSVSTEK
jgi:hypothetical protein